MLLNHINTFAMSNQVIPAFHKHISESWNYNIRNDIYFSISKISFTYLMTLIDFTNNQNNMRRGTWGYIYTLKIKIICVRLHLHIKDQNKNQRKHLKRYILHYHIRKEFAKFVGWRLGFIWKLMWSRMRENVVSFRYLYC